MTGKPNSGMQTVTARRGLRLALILVALVILGIFLTALVALPSLNPKPQVRQASWKEDARGYSISQGSERTFQFRVHGDRVVVPDAPVFHFDTNQDFSVEAWIKANPPFSRTARQLSTWFAAHPKVARFLPKSLAAWIYAHSTDNDFGVTPVVDKHHTPSTIESVGFQMYLDYGRLACQLSEAPLRSVGFQNFVSPGPNLQDRRWHFLAMSVERTSTNGGKLYVDGRQVLVFDPTKQTGDLSNSEPLRIGNHANPTLRCYFRGRIGDVGLYRRALRAEEIAASYRKGR